MKTPAPPSSDEEVQRHKFYGGISSALECLAEKHSDHDIAAHETHNELYDKHNETKHLIEEVNQRINKRTYQNDFDKLEDKVHDLQAKEVAHMTAWVTGKTFIVGAWLVFTLLFAFSFSMLKIQIGDYVEIIELNEEIISTMENQIAHLKTTTVEHKVKHEQISISLADIKDAQEYNRTQNRDLRKAMGEFQEDYDRILKNNKK